MAEEFLPYAGKGLIQTMCQKLDEKFASTEHVGSIDVVSFLGINDEEERERIKQDAYQKVHYLVDKLK